MPTTNPVPSQDPSDLLFNAGKLDEVVSGSNATYTDRLGVSRRTMAGVDAAADLVLGGLGYAPPVAYAAGIALTLTTQTVEYSGAVYAPKLANLPFTTTTWATDSSKFRLIQGVSATDLAASGGSAMIGYMPAGTGAVATTVQSKLRESVSVTDFGADPTGITECTAQIKAAIDYGIANGKSVYVPAGVYLCTHNVLRFTFNTSTTKAFTLFGDGAASILKMGDGLMTETWRVFFDMRPAIDMDLIELRDLVFDNNARGSAAPPNPYDFEQSHTIRFAGAAGTTTKLLRYHNVIVKDPVADGMNNQGDGFIQNWVISNCSEIDRTRVRSSIQQSYMPDNLVITGFTGRTIESEPVAAITTAKSVHISNSTVDILDMAGNTNPNMSTYYISNTKVKEQMLFGGCVLRMNNCDIRISGSGRFNYIGQGCSITDTTVRHEYNSTTGAVTGIDIFGNTSINGSHEITFDNCRFLIDYTGTLPVSANGYLIKGTLACPAAQIEGWEWTIKNSYFDPRAQGSVNAYRNGVWNLIDNSYACAALAAEVAAVFHTHGAPTYGCRATINGGDFRNVVGYGIAVANTSATSQALGSLTLTGTMLGEAALNITKFNSGSISANDAYHNNNRVVQVASLPAYAMNGDTVAIRAGDAVLGTGVEYIATATSQTAPNFRLTRQKGIKRDTTANRVVPKANDIGLMYLDTTLDADGKPIWWNGTAWVDATGATV